MSSSCALQDTWSIGQQTFTVDLVEMGVAKRDREMIAHGIKGLEWGMARPLNDEAIHELSRDCDGQTSRRLRLHPPLDAVARVDGPRRCTCSCLRVRR